LAGARAGAAADRRTRGAAGAVDPGRSIETPDCVVRLAELDGRYLSTGVAGGFTGRVTGMYVTEGRAAFDWSACTPMS
jgi:hypothetical protein